MCEWLKGRILFQCLIAFSFALLLQDRGYLLQFCIIFIFITGLSIKYPKVISFLVPLFLALGWVRGTLYNNVSANDIQNLELGKTVIMHATVSSDPSLHMERSVSSFNISDIHVNGIINKGEVHVTVHAENIVPEYGDKLELTCELKIPDQKVGLGAFNNRAYLRNHFGIERDIFISHGSNIRIISESSFSFPKYIYKFRKWTAAVLDSALPKEEAELAKAMFLRERGELSQDALADFIDTGTVHVIAVAGLHVGILWAVIRLFLLNFIKLSRKHRTWLLAIILIIYAVLTGAEPPVVRAVTMLILYESAFLFKRESDALSSIAAASLIFLSIHPRWIFDFGFQMSIAVVMSLLLWARPLTEILLKALSKLNITNIRAHYFLEYCAIGFIAQLGSLPLTLAEPIGIHPFSFIANLLVIPLLAWILLMLIPWLAAARVYLPAAKMLSIFCLYLPLHLTLIIVDFFAQRLHPWRPLAVAPGWLVFFTYLILWGIAPKPDGNEFS